LKILSLLFAINKLKSVAKYLPFSIGAYLSSSPSSSSSSSISASSSSSSSSSSSLSSPNGIGEYDASNKNYSF